MARIKLIGEDITESIIGAFYEVYNTLGYGFLEHVYATALERELRERGHRVAREVGVQIRYKERVLAYQRIDLIVDQLVVVETKATELLHPTAKRQLRSYLAATTLEVGLLLHFGPEPHFHRLIASNERGRSA
jgi:GxxExxY protein